MYFQPPKNLRRANTVFEKFCKDVHVLPPDTPVFLIDGIGRILLRKRFGQVDFESIYSLLNERDAESFRKRMMLVDAFVVESKDAEGKNFIVVSKDDYGFSRCVVCSSSEKGSIGLHDFVARLCSYRDYLESFDNLVTSSMPRIPVKWIFGLKISGVLEIMDLAGAERDTGKNMTFPLMIGLEKLCSFIQKVNENKTELLYDESDREIYVTVPEVFFKLVVSAAALAERFSHTGKVKLSAYKTEESGSVMISINTRGKGYEGDIFEKALICAFEMTGFRCRVVDADGDYCIRFEVPLAKPEGIVVSDVAVVSSWIDELLESDAVYALHFTISDK